MTEKNSKSIVVNGAGGGIGKVTIKRLADAGFRIYAGASSERSRDALNDIHPNIVPMVMNVAHEESIQKAFEFVKEDLGDQKLFGLWNNAGIMEICAFEAMTSEQIQRVININLVGTMLFFNKMLPLVERGRGRVVVTGSATGLFAAPGAPTYTATKWGLEGFCDSLRVELRQVGVKVVLLQPGLIKTPMAENAKSNVEATLGRLNEQHRADYEKIITKIAEAADNASTTPETVADTAIKAFTDEKPRSRYKSGPDAFAAGIIRMLPDGPRDFLHRKIFGL